MVVGKVDPFEHVLCHQYEAALELYDRRSLDQATDWVGKSIALLCVGRLHEALEGFHRAKELRERDYAKMGSAEGSGADANFIGTVQWLLGKRKEAVETFRWSVDGILDGSIAYGDAAGGVTQGLLLWYASSSVEDSPSLRASIKYLKNRTKRKAIEDWPGPLALHLVGQRLDQEILKREFSTDDLETIDRHVASDVLARRHYTNALFYMAAKRGHDGDERKAKLLLLRCARLENTFFELEWYLARNELGLDFRWMPMGPRH